MGDDFQYQYAESWFKQMDKFIHFFELLQLIRSLELDDTIGTHV